MKWVQQALRVFGALCLQALTPGITSCLVQGSFVTIVVLVKSIPPANSEVRHVMSAVRAGTSSSEVDGHCRCFPSKDYPYHPSPLSSSVGGVACTANKLAMYRTPGLHLRTSHLGSPVPYDFDSRSHASVVFGHSNLVACPTSVP